MKHYLKRYNLYTLVGSSNDPVVDLNRTSWLGVTVFAVITQRWLQSIFFNEDGFDFELYDIYSNGTRVGCLWITKVNKYRTPFCQSNMYELTVVINSEFRGKEFGKKSIEAICERKDNIVALVRDENEWSNRLFSSFAQKNPINIGRFYGTLGSRYIKI